MILEHSFYCSACDGSGVIQSVIFNPSIDGPDFRTVICKQCGGEDLVLTAELRGI